MTFKVGDRVEIMPGAKWRGVGGEYILDPEFIGLKGTVTEPSDGFGDTLVQLGLGAREDIYVSPEYLRPVKGADDEWSQELARILNEWQDRNVNEMPQEALEDFAYLVRLWGEAA